MVQVEEGQAEAQGEAQVEGQGEGEAQAEGGEGEAEKVKRGSPTYAVQAVDELPPKPERGGLNIRTRKTIYLPLLAQVVAQPGQWFELARYTSQTGARSSAKSVNEAIESGEIPVAGGTFQFDTRRKVAGVDEEGNAIEIPSVLYAKFVRAESES